MASIKPAPLDRPLSDIAREIWADFKAKPMAYAAEPYIDALYYVDQKDLHGYFGEDKIEYVVIYLLENLGTWRGDVARRVKAELRAALAHHKIAAHLPTD